MQPGKAITLIALVITIIVLLILAGITISLTIGKNGIFIIADKATKDYIDAENRELNELDKIYSSILVSDNSKVTITMEELNQYIDHKVEEKYGNEIENIKKELEDLKTQDISIKGEINEIVNHNYTYTELASSTSTTKDNVVKLKENLSNYKYIWIGHNSDSGNLHGSGIIQVNVFKTRGAYFGANNGYAGSISYAKYKDDNSVYLYKDGTGGKAVLYGIK